MEIKEDKLKELSLKLLNRFFFNKTVYAEQVQLEDKKIVYNTKYKKIDAVKIKYGIQNKLGYMSYQQNQSNIKWICFDFDILKEKIGSNYDFFSSEYRENLYDEVEILLDKLEKLKIKYLLEYSGNRGVHVWIFFKEETTKAIGYTILNKIIQGLEFKYINNEKGIALDKYPKNGNSEGNKIGCGVKIPVSYHKKSQRYSYLIEKLEEIKKVEEIDDNFIESQINILDKCEENSVLDLIEKLEIDNLDDEESFSMKTGILDEEYGLEDIESMLKKSIIFQKIFNQKELSEKERSVIVSTLIRLQTKENPKYGEKLVYEFFSKREDFDRAITIEKMNSLKYLYPLNIKYLEKLYNIKCEYCKKNKIKSAIELIDNIRIEEITSLQSKIKRSIYGEINYLEYNDEVPLIFIKEDLKRIDEKEIESKINDIKRGKKVDIKYYEYIRKEEDKERKMYSLDAESRVLTTTAMFLIDDVIGGQYTNSNVYSYKLNRYGNKEKNEIFENWSILWGKYVSEIQDKITEEAFNDYYIIKLDVHSFYDSINHEILKKQLYGKPNTILKNILNKNSKQKNDEYKNICNFLINCMGKKGMPQGPAYARYLAEIYISKIDDIITKFIEDDMEFYFRYVDDIVILVKNKERGKELLKIVDKSMKEIDLQLNGQKKEEGYVKDIKGKIVNNDIEKYFVDNIEEDMPLYLIKKAVKILKNMLNEINEKENFSYKNIPFFLTHLVDEKLIKNNLEKIKKNIIASEEGRGSMFKHFYRNIIFKYNSDLGFYKNIRGLSRANFINELLANTTKIEDYRGLEKMVAYYLNQNNIQDYEKIELYAIALKTGINIEQVEQEILKKAIKSVNKINSSEENFECIMDSIQREDDQKERLIYTEEILSKLEKVPNYELLNENIYSCLFEFCINDIEIMQKMYNLVCYNTLFLSSKEKVDKIWENFENAFSEKQIKKINDVEWLKYKGILKQSEFKENIVIEYLIDVLGERVKRKVIEAEKNYVISLLMYFRMAEVSAVESKILKDEVEKIVKEKNMLIFDWTMRNEINYFPDNETAIKNMEFNNRIMLYNHENNKMLVRGKKEIFNEKLQENLQKEGLNISGEPKYYTIIDCNEETCNLYEKIKGKNIFEALEITSDIIKRIDKEKLVNIFEKGTLCNRNNEFYFEFSKEDNKFIIPDSKNELYEINNDLKHFYGAIFKTLTDLDETSNMKITEQIVYTPMNIDTMLIPWNIKDFVKEKVEYLMEFADNLKEIKQENQLDAEKIETAKIKTLMKTKNERFREESSELYKEYNLIKNYNKIGINAPESKILYGKVEIKEGNLNEIIQTLINSINKNNIATEEVRLITQKLKNDLKKIEEKNNKKAEEFKYKKTMEDENIEELVEGKDIVIFGSKIENNEKKEILLDEHEYYFVNDNIIILLPIYLEKSIEYIKKRNGDFENSKMKKFQNLPNYTKAVENIKEQNDITESEAKEKLNNFLTKQKDSRYCAILVNIISKYRVMHEKELQEYIKNVKEYLEREDCITISLKDLDKDKENGTSEILKTKGHEAFERGRKYICKLKENNRKIQNGNFDLRNKKLVIVSDIGISGGQFINTVDINNKENNLERYKLYENYKKAIQSASEIILINCIYTEKYKMKIEEYLKDKKCNFIGQEINSEEYLPKFILNKNEINLFKEFLEKCAVINNKMPGSKRKFKDFVENLDDEHVSQAFIARFKTMPKKHYIIFDDEIFNYKKEEYE